MFGVHLPHGLTEGGFCILDAMRLVDDQILPADFRELGAFLEHPLVGCHQDIPPVPARGLVDGQMLRLEFDPFLLGPAHADGPNGRTPLFEFPYPVSCQGEGGSGALGSLREGPSIHLQGPFYFDHMQRSAGTLHLPTTDLGTMTMCGPLTPRPSRR
jgi:hypothetical protein